MVAITQYKGGLVANAQRVVPVQAKQTGIGAVVPGLEKAAQAFADIQDRVDTADAKAADSQYSDLIRTQLYDDKSGFMNSQGKNALDARKGVSETLKRSQEEILAGLRPAARAKAEAALSSRYSSAMRTIDTHTAGQTQTYLNGASNARISSSVSDAISMPDQAEKKLAVAVGEIRDQAGRNGWSPEQTSLEILKTQTEAYSGVVRRIANADPEQAMSYLDTHRDLMDGAEVGQLETTLAPMVKRARGTRIGQIAAQGVDPNYMATVAQGESAGDPKARNPRSSATGLYQITDATWTGLMNQHPELGLTADGRTDPEQSTLAMLALTRENAQGLKSAGVPLTGGNLYAAHFLGIGSAEQVLKASDDTLLRSLLSSDQLAANPSIGGTDTSKMTVGQFKEWAASVGGTQIAAGSHSGIEQIMAISDPTERAAAVQSFNLMSKQQTAQIAAQKQSATDTGMQYIKAGKDVRTLPFEAQKALGPSGMSALVSYQQKAVSGTMKTDPTVWASVNMMTPDQLRSIDPVKYLPYLTTDDYQKLVSMQRQALSDARGSEARVSALGNAMSLVSPELQAAGFGTTGLKGDDLAKAQGNIAQFQNALMDEMTTFRKAHNDEAPTEADVKAMANKLLLPVVLKSDRRNLFGGHASTQERLFQAGGRLGQTGGGEVDLDYSYDSIPPSARARIEAALTRRNGRTPSEAETLATYQRFVAENIGQAREYGPDLPAQN